MHLRLLGWKAMPAAIRRYWRNGTRWCALFYVEDRFEIRIYDGTALIALWPCESSQRAVELALAWHDNPPTWWPPF
jgi:hypothetical protein